MPLSRAGPTYRPEWVSLRAMAKSSAVVTRNKCALMPEYCIESLFKKKIAIFDGLSVHYDQRIERFDQLQGMLHAQAGAAFGFAQGNCVKCNAGSGKYRNEVPDGKASEALPLRGKAKRQASGEPSAPKHACGFLAEDQVRKSLP